MKRPLPRRRATRLVALELALREAKRGVKERGGWNRGPRVDVYERSDTLPGVADTQSGITPVAREGRFTSPPD